MKALKNFFSKSWQDFWGKRQRIVAFVEEETGTQDPHIPEMMKEA